MSVDYQTDVLRTLREALEGQPAAPTLVFGRGCLSMADGLHAAGDTWLMSADCRDIPAGMANGSVGLLPPERPFERVICRLPRSKDELHYLASMSASLLSSGGAMWLAGHMREGIKSATRVLEERVGPVHTVRTKRRTRVLVARRDEAVQQPLSLEQTRRTFTVEGWRGPKRFDSLVGAFAHGKLDGGTERLLNFLRDKPLTGAVLDMGSGVGTLGLCAAMLSEVTSVDLVEVMWPGVEASRLNAKALGTSIIAPVTHHLASVCDAPSGPFDVVVTNPPFHDGKGEDRQAIARFSDAARRRLKPSGTFWVVANRHLGYREPLEQAFAKVEVPWEDGLFRIWCCRVPRRG